MVDDSSPRGDAVDREAIAALQGGDRRALALLYHRHRARLMAIGVRILKTPAEAEDVLHAVFIEAWQRAGSYRPDRATVRTWLSLRMRSRCLDRVRSAAWTRTSSLPPDYDMPSPWTPSSPPRRIDAQRASAAVDALTTQQRAVVELSYFEGLSSRSIGERLGIPTGTVKSRMRSALAALRQLLKDDMS